MTNSNATTVHDTTTQHHTTLEYATLDYITLLMLRYSTLHCISFFFLRYTTLLYNYNYDCKYNYHYITPALHCTALHCTTLHHTTPHYTYYTAPHLQLQPLVRLRYTDYTTSQIHLHYTTIRLQVQLQLRYLTIKPAVVVEWPLHLLQKTRLEPPFGPSGDSFAIRDSHQPTSSIGHRLVR